MDKDNYRGNRNNIKRIDMGEYLQFNTYLDIIVEIMERLDNLIDLFETLENVYVVNELLLIKKDITVTHCCKSLPQNNYCQVCKLPTDGEKCYSKRCPI